jgi:hypothetical protein
MPRLAAAFFTFVFAVPVAFFPPVRLPFPADAISCLVGLILVAQICFKRGQTLNASVQRGRGRAEPMH